MSLLIRTNWGKIKNFEGIEPIKAQIESVRLLEIRNEFLVRSWC